MITTPQDYIKRLQEIQDSYNPTVKMINSDTEPKFEIDADTRTIKVPNELQNVGVYKDHMAETIYFTIDRYFDDVDLMDKICIVQYINANSEQYVHAVTDIYLNDTQDKIIFGWTITDNVTSAVGKVEFSIRFYTLEDESFTYSFNTIPAFVYVLNGLNITDSSETSPSQDDLSLLVSKINIAISNLDKKDPVNYNNLENKPSINGVLLEGDLTTEDLKIEAGGKVPENVLTTDSVDTELSDISENPVQNKVIDSKIKEIVAAAALKEDLSNTNNDINTLKGNIVTLTEKTDSTNKNVKDLSGELDKLKEEIQGLTYVPIEISSFINNINEAEKGQVINNIILDWDYNKIPTELLLDDVSIETSLKTYTLSAQNINSDKIYTLTAKDSQNNSSIKTTSITFVDAIYYGAKEESEYDNTFVLSLNKKLAKDKDQSVTINANTNQYIYICTPVAFGECNFSVGGFTGGFEKIQEISVTNGYNYTTNYNLYKSVNPNLGETTVQIY
jgi:hypothetical protein